MTPQQRQTLIHIRNYVASHGVVPSIRELMALENLRSTGAVHRRLHALMEMGQLVEDRRGGRYRAYRLADDIDLTAVPTNKLREEISRREGGHG